MGTGTGAVALRLGHVARGARWTRRVGRRHVEWTCKALRRMVRRGARRLCNTTGLLFLAGVPYNRPGASCRLVGVIYSFGPFQSPAASQPGQRAGGYGA